MEKDNKQFKKPMVYTGLIVLTLIVAFLAGISGEFFTRYYLSRFAFFRDLYFTQETSGTDRNIIIQEPKKVVVEQELRIDQIKGEILPAVAKVFVKNKTNPNLMDRLFLPEDYLGQALILTSDGWLITTENVPTNYKENVIVTGDKKIYPIEKIQTDPLSKIVFLKISAENLPIIKIADLENMSVGQQVLAYNTFLSQIDLAEIKALDYKDINTRYDWLTSSQVLDKSLLLNDSLDSDFKGSPIVNLEGQVLAIFSKEDKAIPLTYIQPVINQVLKAEKITRPYLGINYLNLAKVNGLSETERQGLKYGALIWPDKTGVGIMANSPLNKILVNGDIITSIEGQNLDADHDLIDVLLEYKAGQQIRIKYVHEQKEQEASLTL